ncbi:T9SS type A sorting domain-containing protein [Rufibacter psychrotolerans]|uniref:T9SS type A sorting domain-containing protein n=1 Tax=Rufibacter psychrotolerans TaxID=2812556 RepID=UPI001968489F|nr:T9SS type A sorting domain-containing protein [Rufibacter sp. SYSU D00308]
MIEVTLSNVTTTPAVEYANLKFNKAGVFTFELDDNSGKAVDVLKVLSGGKASNGVTYPGKYFTDGCGNKIYYRGAIALNLLNNYNQDQIVYTSSGKKINQEGLNALVRNKWTLENHGYAHSASNTLIDGDIAKNIHENTKVFYTKMAAAGLPVRMRVAVTPTNDEGYHPTSKQLGYIGLTTQTKRDEGPMFFGYAVLSADWSQMLYTHRSFNDKWDQATTDSFKEKIDRLLLLKATPATPQMFRLGSHGPDVPKFAELMNHLQTASRDRVWVPSLQELIEYFEVKRLLVRTTTYDAATKKLVITLDYSKIPEHNRFRDVSLLLKGGNIAAVTVKSGTVDKLSFNASTGLINLFKEKTTFANPALDVLPPKITNAKLIEASKVRLVFDRAVVLTKEGFTVKSAGVESPVVGVAGSGTVWDLKLQNAFTSSSVLTLYYRMQRGASAESGKPSMKVGSYIGKKVVNALGTSGSSTGTLTALNDAPDEAESATPALVVHPNPVESVAYVSSQGMAGPATVTVYNSIGAVVLTKKEQLETGRPWAIDFSGLPAGTYLVQVATAEGVVTSKVIKK